MSAVVAQLGERETEDLKVTSSILVHGNIFVNLFNQIYSRHFSTATSKALSMCFLN